MITAVSQNRFAAPQRIQENNQAQTFGSNEGVEKKNERGNIKSNIDIIALGTGMALGLWGGLGMRNAEHRINEGLTTTVDSLKYEQSYLKKENRALEQATERLRADSLTKAASKIRP